MEEDFFDVDGLVDCFKGVLKLFVLFVDDAEVVEAQSSELELFLERVDEGSDVFGSKHIETFPQEVDPLVKP